MYSLVWLFYTCTAWANRKAIPVLYFSKKFSNAYDW